MAAATTTTTTTTPATAAEGYEQCRALLYHQVAKFRRGYGGDREELEGLAHLAFVQGDQYYRRGVRPNGEPITWDYAVEIRRWVWYQLFDARRTELQRYNRAAVRPCGEDAYRVPDNSWCRTTFEEGLGDDAQYVLGLLLGDGPQEVYATAAAKGGEPRNLRSTVRAWLAAQPARPAVVAQHAGYTEIKWVWWTPARINAAFEQIKAEL